MRHFFQPFAILVLMLCALRAFGASTTSTVPVHAIGPLHPILSPCHPATGAGDVVSIPGVPSFSAESIAFSNNQVVREASSLGRYGRGEITIVKLSDAASPSLLRMIQHNSQVSNATLTMRKAGGDPGAYLVYTLSQVRVIGLNVIKGAGGRESVRLGYQSVSYCRS